MIFSPEPYQSKLRDFLVSHDRAAGFVGVGLGKTASTLWAFDTLRRVGEVKSMLMVGPMRVANLTWPNEISKWDNFRHLRFERLRDVGDKPSGKADVYLTSYERLLRRVKKGNEWASTPRFSDLSFCDTVVFDELTKAKNPASDQINALRPLLKQHRRWGLTGTPRPNSLLELFAQVRLLDDGKRLGPSFDQFKKTWFEPEDWNEYKWLPKPDSERRIYERIHDLVITLKSSDYLNIPDTVVEDIEVPLPQAAHGIYKELEKELMVLIQSKGVVAVNAAVLVNKLLQICGGAIYSTPEGGEREVVDVHQSKLVALKRLLVERPERAIIACNLIHEADRICRAVPGAVNVANFKGDLESAWNEGKIPHLVCDPRSLGHGLNLQVGGRWTIWYSPCHSRELYDQLNGRTARKGQESAPIVSRLLCPQTIDEAVVESLRERGDAQTEMMTVLSNFRLQGLCFS